MTRISTRAAGALLAAALAGCGAPAATQTAPQPAPADHGAHAGHAPATSTSRAHPADVRFLQGMITHHAQAVEMTALAPSRAEGAGLKLLAQRISVSQDDEMTWMRRWLRTRGAGEPDAHAHHGPDHARMPGMATAEEMRDLAASTGAEFDRRFLTLMIRHHEGALAMVAELFGTPGGGQDAEIYEFASHVDADQRMEIARMRAMLDGAPAGAPRR